MQGSKRLLLLELNEFNVEFFRSAARQLELPGIRRLLAMPHSALTTRDRIEHQGLDPWVQWVNVHTGCESAQHGIRRLGQVPDLGRQQIWEALSEQGITSGVWGAMNAARRSAEHCRFFLPDPWTFSEPGYPARFDLLLDLPRYYGKHYLQPDPRPLLLGSLRLIAFVLRSGALPAVLRQAPALLRGLLRLGLRNHVLFAGFDLVNTALFLHYWRREAPDFAILFLNSIAHFQHHAWPVPGRLDAPTGFALQSIDRCLTMLFDALPADVALVVANGLTQQNIAELETEIVYRQIEPAAFLAALDIRVERIEQMMTNEAFLFFADPAEAQRAAHRLAEARVDGLAPFDVDYPASSPCRVFYQVPLARPLREDAVLRIGDRELRFFDYFEALCARSGEHVPRGDAFSRGIELPDRLPNHRLYDHLLAYFAAPGPARPAASA